MYEFIGKMIHRAHQTQCPFFPIQVRGSGDIIFPRVLCCLKWCTDGRGGRDWGSGVRPAIAGLHFTERHYFNVIRIDMIGKCSSSGFKSGRNNVLQDLMRGNTLHGRRLRANTGNTLNGAFEYLSRI